MNRPLFPENDNFQVLRPEYIPNILPETRQKDKVAKFKNQLEKHKGGRVSWFEDCVVFQFGVPQNSFSR